MIDTNALEALEAANPYPQSQVDGWSASREGQHLLSCTLMEVRNSHRASLSRGFRAAWAVPGLALVAVIVMVARPMVSDRPAKDEGFEATNLEALARMAAIQDEPSAGAAHHWKTAESAVVSFAGPASFEYLSTIKVERWIEPDASGRTVSGPAEISFPTPEDEAAWEAAGSPELGLAPSTKEYAPGELTYEDYSDLPVDDDLLFQAVEERASTAGPSVEAEMFIVIGDLLRAGTLPPELRASLFRASARIPGIEVKDAVVDSQGRPAVAVSLTFDDDNGSMLKTERMFDSQTTRMLQETTTVVGKTAFEIPSPPPGFPASARPPMPPTLRTPVGTMLERVVYL